MPSRGHRKALCFCLSLIQTTKSVATFIAMHPINLTETKSQPPLFRTIPLTPKHCCGSRSSPTLPQEDTAGQWLSMRAPAVPRRRFRAAGSALPAETRREQGRQCYRWEGAVRAAGRAVKGASERDRRAAAAPRLAGGCSRLHRRRAGPGLGPGPTPRAPD